MASLYTTTPVSKRPAPTQRTVQRYRGFSTISGTTQNFALYDFELIKQDLMNNFHIRQGERLMNPTYGTIIWDLLFEPLTDQVKHLILEDVNNIFNNEPRVRAGNIVITPYDTGLQIQCTLTYLLYNIQDRMKLQFDQANGLNAQ
jgi:phage baseplate assembly protein W